MGIVDKLKKVTTWESALVVMFFLGCCTAIIIVGSFVLSDIMIIGGLVALGIPTSFLGTIGQRVSQAVPNPTPEKIYKLNDERLDKIELVLAEISNEFVNMKSQFEIVRNDIMNFNIEKLCREENE